MYYFRIGDWDKLDNITAYKNFAPMKLKSGTILAYLFDYFHAPRAYLNYPAIKIQEVLNTDLDYTFSIYLFLIISINLLLMLKVIDNLQKKKFLYWSIYSSLYTFTLFFMNGRLVFAHSGFAILIFCLLIKFKRRTIYTLALFLGLWLCSVSSGTFLLSYLFVSLSCLAIKKEFRNANIFILILFSPLLTLSIIKPIIEHLGNPFYLLHHGWGGFLIKKPPLAVFLFTTLIIIAAKLIKRLKIKINKLTLLSTCSILSMLLSSIGKSIFWGALPLHFITLLIFKEIYLTSSLEIDSIFFKKIRRLKLFSKL